MAEKQGHEAPIPVNVDPEQPDTESDSNFNYDQPVDEANGVPREDWIVEQPFDSAEWLDKEPIVYVSDRRKADGGEAEPAAE